MNPKQKKIDTFFELIRAIYGSARFEMQWPDTTHLDAAKILWGDRIARHTEKELRGAIDHAQSMILRGEKDWQWPNIGLILSGARWNLAAHKPFLIPKETEEDKKRWKEIAHTRATQILDLLNDKKTETEDKKGSDNDFGF